MPASPSPAVRAALLGAACAVVAGCGSFDDSSRRIASIVTPYRVEVVQGNFVSKEQVEALRPGMSRQQVRDVLGTPLVASVFHANRWDFVFTLDRQGVAPQHRHLAIFFKGEVMDRVEGDPMPSESDFVATLDAKRRNAKIPVLEATEEQLKQYPPRAAAAASAPARAAQPAAASYPPLEPPSR